MSLTAGCPRCPTPVAGSDTTWSCPEHGEITPLWRPYEASYDAFVEHLRVSSGFPTYLPWPISPGWTISDFAAVGDGRARATMSCGTGSSPLDGPVDVMVVTEEAGTGFGARCAGISGDDPGAGFGDGPPTARVRVGSQTVSLWPVTTAPTVGEFDRSVFAGEAVGRWLWIILRPASAMLLLREEWILRDVSGLGPALVELPFGGPRPSW